MTDEKEKIDIEDIKDPEDLDIDKAVSEEEPAEEPIEVAKEEVENSDEKNPEPEGDKDVLEKVTDEKSQVEELVEKEETAKPQKIKKAGQKNKMKFIIIGLIVALLAAAAVLGVLYYLQQRSKTADVNETKETEQTQDDQSENDITDEESTEKILYINSEVGLNLRETPDTKAKVLVIIPFATKITVLEEQAGWVKTTYNNQTGWISVGFTQATNPLIYKNETYGFGLTFKASWAGYKFFEADNAGSTTVKTYYVALPTSDTAWDESVSGIPKGYASLFVMGIYTKAEWSALAGGEMLPAKLGESDKYVYTYLPGQAHATDLKTQYGEINEIIKAFEVLK